MNLHALVVPFVCPHRTMRCVDRGEKLALWECCECKGKMTVIADWEPEAELLMPGQQKGSANFPRFTVHGCDDVPFHPNHKGCMFMWDDVEADPDDHRMDAASYATRGQMPRSPLTIQAIDEAVDEILRRGPRGTPPFDLRG